MLLTKSDEASDDMKAFDASQYLSEYVQLTLEATNDGKSDFSTCIDSADEMAHSTSLVCLETYAKVLRHHISEILGFVLVLQEVDDVTIQEISDVALKHLTGRVSEAHIRRDGAKQSFMILRRILKLHAIGLSVVGKKVTITQNQFIEGMKSVSKHISQTSKGSYIVDAGSSLTELFVISGYWLSSNGVSVRQREKFLKPIDLMCIILQDHVREASITPHELAFCINFLVSIALDRENQFICVSVVESLSDILKVLFYHTKDATIVSKVVPTIHKLCLALLAIHKRSFDDFDQLVKAATMDAMYQKKSCIGILPKLRDADMSWDEENVDSMVSESSIIGELINAKSNDEGKTLSDVMIGAYNCLDTILNSGKVALDDIVGADDIIGADGESSQRRAFGDVNEKYEVQHLFSNIQGEDKSLVEECGQFMQIMNQYPVTNQGARLLASCQQQEHNSVDALARMLALRRLERSITSQNASVDEKVEIPNKVLESLVAICQSNDSDEAKVISSKAIGGIRSDWIHISPEHAEMPINTDIGYDPLQGMKVKALSMIGRFLLFGSADIKLISMKTAKSLLSSSDGRDCWALIEDEQSQGVLKPFLVCVLKDEESNGAAAQKEQVVLSKNYINKLKAMTGDSNEGSEWCWSLNLWNCFSQDRWIKNITNALIECCLGKDSLGHKCSFIRHCQGLSAKDASFASCLFPAIIYFLLDSESGDTKYDKHSVRDMVMSDIAIGASSGRMNTTITKCFGSVLSSFNNSEGTSDAYDAVKVILETLETLHSVTKQRFILSESHKRNKAEAPKEQKKARKSLTKQTAPTRPDWRGVPYGVVLRLDGLEVARACMKSKLYHSAIYYW
jgi:hypothetical protein